MLKTSQYIVGTAVSVPEPSTLVLLLGGLLTFRRRR